MAERGPSLFLERQSYRRRRLIDWIRVLPVLGLALWMLPLLWPVGEDASVSTASALIFIFVTWLVLVIVAALSARALRRIEAQDAGDKKGT